MYFLASQIPQLQRHQYFMTHNILPTSRSNTQMLIALPFTSAISCWYLHKDIPNPEMFDAKAISFHPPPRCPWWSFTCNTPSGARQRMWCLQPSKRWKSQLCYFLVVTAVKNLPTMLEMQETWLSPCIGKIPWRRNWQPSPVFLPGESHGQRSLVGCSP